MSDDKPKTVTRTKDLKRMATRVQLGTKDVKATAWSDPVILDIKSIDPMHEERWGGFVQGVKCELNGEAFTFNIKYNDPAGEVDTNETGPQSYKLKWYPDGDWIKGEATLAKPKENLNAPAGKNVWEMKDLRIAKESCLRSAVMFVQERVATKEDVDKLAKHWLRWIYDETV